ELEERGEAVERHIDEARSDWERKRSDPAVPGAKPPDDDERAAPEDTVPPEDPGDAEGVATERE
ncbi:MAG: hypothetical protein LC685_01530, partial [Actinobacteria bacterium]|nr:hypothetical protein [Actinomycetota bacterium]